MHFKWVEDRLTPTLSHQTVHAEALRAIIAPDKLNFAALGNQVRQLHVHLFARHSNDDAWPDPVCDPVRDRYLALPRTAVEKRQFATEPSAGPENSERRAAAQVNGPTADCSRG